MHLLLLIPLLLLAGWLLWRGRAAPPPAARAPLRALRVPLPPADHRPRVAPTGGPGAADDAPTPPECVGSYDWRLADTLAPAQRTALLTALGSISRPPSALNQMLTPQFLDQASSQALGELITSEPQIAAKVLATVNAPYYGLARPVSSIGQAVTFLGLNTVRSICLRGLMEDALPAAQPALRRAVRQLWNGSAIASELCNRLSGKLGLPDAGALVAQVLLSFLGHLTTVTLLNTRPEAAGAPLAGGSLLLRTGVAQDLFGVGQAEIGGLLLHAWNLPAAIVDEVRAIDRLLVTSPGEVTAEQGARLALAHLCARIGEQLASSSVPTTAGSLAGMAAGLAEAEECFHLRQHLASPMLARLQEHLQAPDLVQAMRTLQQGMQAAR